MEAEQEGRSGRAHLRLVYSGNPLTSDSTVPIPSDWFDVDSEEVKRVYGWTADNVPDAAWDHAMSSARTTGSTFMIEVLLRDDSMEVY